MQCPLVLYQSGSLGTVDYFAPCECLKLCEMTACKYTKNGFLVQFNTAGSTATNTISIVGKACGGSLPLVAASNGEVLTNANITAGSTYRVYPVMIGGVLRGIVQGL